MTGKSVLSDKLLGRTVEQGIEFLIVTVWDSMEAIKQFAGESATVAVVPPAVQAMMVEFDRDVVHYTIESQTVTICQLNLTNKKITTSIRPPLKSSFAPPWPRIYPVASRTIWHPTFIREPAQSGQDQPRS